MEPKEVKLQTEIKDLKKDIKKFKEKIMKKRKIIREFKLFCKDISEKYNIYLNNNKGITSNNTHKNNLYINLNKL